MDPSNVQPFKRDSLKREETMVHQLQLHGYKGLLIDNKFGDQNFFFTCIGNRILFSQDTFTILYL